jgi:hypothetical protein
MKRNALLFLAVIGLATGQSLVDDITTLDGNTYTDVRDVNPKANGLFFVVGSGESLHGVTVAFTNLSTEAREKYHCDSYEIALVKARDENKLLGFIMEWDSMLIPGYPMGRGSNCGLAHFYDVFNDNLVLVFVRHESELGKVPGAVGQGFFGPDEGGFAPNMAVVTADCSKFVCEIPYGGNNSNGQIREQIFREKIAVIKKFIADQEGKK